MSSFLFVTAGVFFNVLAGGFIKYSIVSGCDISLRNPLSFLFNYYIWASITFYGLSFVAYAKSLQTLPLNVAQPITMGGVVFFTALLSFIIFKEEITFVKILGMLFILFGVFCVSWNA